MNFGRRKEKINRLFFGIIIACYSFLVLGTNSIAGGAKAFGNFLTEEEEQWIDEHPVCKVGYKADYMPFCDKDENGEVDGVIAEIVSQMLIGLQLQDRVTISYVAYDSFMGMAEGVQKGEIDCFFPAMEDEYVLKKMQIAGTESLLSVPFYVAYKGTYDDNTFRTIAMNNRPMPKITQDYADSEILQVETAQECLDAILDGRATCTIMSSYRLQTVMNNPKYRSINTMPFNGSVSYCIGVAKDKKILQSILSKGIVLLDESLMIDRVYKYIEHGKQYSFREFAQDNMFLVGVVVLSFFFVVLTSMSLYVKGIKKAKKESELQLEKNKELAREKENRLLEITDLNERLQDTLETVNILAALSYDFEAVHVADLDAGTFSTLRLSSGLENMNFHSDTVPYGESVVKIVETVVSPEYQEEFKSILQIDALKERMEGQEKFSYRYAIKPDDSGHYVYEMTFIRATADPARHLVVIGAKCIDDILKMEREEGQYNAALLHECVFFYEFDVTEGMISGEFASRKGYDPTFDLQMEFPMRYDAFNKLRTEELGLVAASKQEEAYWTCQGLLDAYRKGNRVVALRYSSDELNLFWNAKIILLEDETSHHLHAVYICKDVTEMVVSEQKQKKALEKALEEAQRANAAKSEFLSRMSHDIRTPLNGIIGLMEINDRHMHDIELVNENRKKARAAADYLLSLINDVLDMSKLENTDVVLPNEPFNLYNVCEDVLTICGIRAKENGITIISDEGVALKYRKVYGSLLHVKQIFMNLINNAIKYNKPGGTIWCTSALQEVNGDKAMYSFTVKDTGVGMSESFMKDMYKPFTQEKNDARSKYQGTGLGMAIVKSLVDKMNGTITCESEVGVGTTFTVTLPFTVLREEEKKPEGAVNQQDKSIAGMHILLVEDNALNMEIATTILEEAGADITPAENGKVAVSIYEENEPDFFDLVLMDIMMPEMDGYEATRKIRMSDKADARTIPIIAMTANAFAEDVRKAKDAGMNAHLAKPIQVNLLLQTILHNKKA